LPEPTPSEPVPSVGTGQSNFVSKDRGTKRPPSAMNSPVIDFTPAPTAPLKRRRANDSAIISVPPGTEFISGFHSKDIVAAKRALYIFSGLKRRASIGDFLSKMGWTVTQN